MQRPRLIGTGLLAFVLATGAAASPAAARVAKGLYNTRYCEVFELRGTPPDALVTVWNTIGLSDCPAEAWQALDPGALAASRGDTAVILNGPRHWLMDSAEGKPGRSDVFGTLRMRQVATIPIHSAAELVQTPYTERTIVRRNTWTWKRGRTVYELLAPGGATYVMQSYSLIRDPALTLADLPGLGGRLAPPEGWRFRVRRLRQNLVLAARGSATIIQDELLNTYQRE
jgi:haloalkane dehalogenase